MGNNAAFTFMEASVIAAYDAGIRGEALAPFLEPYRGTDIDEGGMRDLKSKDGKGIEQIIVEAFATPKDVETWKNSDDEDEVYDIYSRITHGRLGWC